MTTGSAERSSGFAVRPRSAMVALALALGLMLTACQTAPIQQDEVAQIAGAKEALDRPDPTLIVDCLLPGKIKKMGTSFTYVTPRRPVKVSSQDCEIRGGEYVAFDRANYETALRVWLPMAEQGDVMAQTYVGAIYEKGLGLPPDFAKAALWYQKAADQGSAQAQFALGYMYETGQGVERKPAEAFRLYRLAAGLPEEDIPASAVFLSDIEKQKLAEQTAAEQALLEKVADEVSVKQQEMTAMQQQLADAKAKLDQQEAAAKRQTALAQQARADEQRSKRDVEKRQIQVKEVDAQLAAKRELLVEEDAKLQQQASLAQQRGNELKELIERISARKNDLTTELSALDSASSNLGNRSRQSANAAEQAQLVAEQTALQEQMAQKQKQINEANDALVRQRTLAEEKGRELNALVAQVDQRKASLRLELAALDQAHNQAQHDRTQLKSQRASLDQGEAQEHDQKLVDLAKQRELIAQLESQAKDNAQKLAYLQRAQGKDKLALLAPKIEIIDPQLPVVRSSPASMGAPVFSVTEGVLERSIIGRVTAAEQLMLVTVNDRRVEVAENGVFNTSLKILPTATLVNIVAVDNGGNRGETQFVLAPASQARALPGQANVGVVATAVGKINLPDIEFGGYHALLIGNNEYKHLPKLQTPIKDVEEIARVLKGKYSFKSTTVLKNATRYDVITAMNKLRKELTSHDNLIIYYAGHGELDRVNMSGQWLPVDAEQENTANWISNNSLTELINAIPAKHVMLVADSCYSGILTRSALTNIQQGQTDDSRMTWIKKMVKRRSRTVLTSGGVAPVLDEGGGEHSVFARALLSSLESNNEVMEGQRLFRQVSAAVSIAADRYQVEQVPEYAPIRHAGHESGDFFFVPHLSGV